MKPENPAKSERALLVQVLYGAMTKPEAADSLAELERLADTAGVNVLGSITQRREKPDAAFFIGQGKLAEIQLACRSAAANLLIFDNELAPFQVNNLDLATGIKVIDRTELILQIFARRARTAEAQIQVELAQLQYLASRIPVSARQARFSGGIGMRGPGESPFQLRRAPILKRITILKQKLKLIQKRRALTRTRRPWPVICLVGYTNAGKSTMLNVMAEADAYVDDRLFATLDTKSRMIRLADGRAAMLTDTVGFIRHLPHGLVASFRSTLEEIGLADFLLIVADAGARAVHDHIRVAQSTLAEMGAAQIPSILVLNKIDQPGAAAQINELLRAYPQAFAVSAIERRGLPELVRQITELLKPPSGLF